MRSFRWALIQYDCNPYKKRKEGQRHTQRADHTETQGEGGHLQAKQGLPRWLSW